MKLLELIFWTSLFLLVYPYVIYPILIFLFSRFFPRSSNLAIFDEDWPSVTLIISAYNEEEVIREKLSNSLSLSYPDEKLRILVVSDASSDDTDSIVTEIGEQHSQVGLHRQSDRLGKTAGLNSAIDLIDSEIVVFSDANAIYDQEALVELVKYFKDERVGYVVGAARYNENPESMANQNEDTFWNYELLLKKWESDYYSVVGGDGAIYAIRRSLYEKLDIDDINDFINPLQIIARDYLGIFNPNAVCFEDASSSYTKEFGRKRRIANRSWRALRKTFFRFKPLKHKKFLFELISHKAIRWFGFLFIALMMLSSMSIALISHDLLHSLIATGFIILFLVIARVAYLDRKNIQSPKLFSFAYYFMYSNYYALLGIVDDIRGVRHATWDHIRNSE